MKSKTPSQSSNRQQFIGSKYFKPLTQLEIHLKKQMVNEFLDFMDKCQKKVLEADIEEELKACLRDFPSPTPSDESRKNP